MKRCYREKGFSAERMATIEKANEIIESYQAQGYKLTLRQLYYQFVSRDLVPNTERSYKNLGSVVSEARLAGLVDWDAIEDRGRVASTPTQFQDVEHLMANAINWYRLPRWAGQENYVELWVEKQALAGVLEPVADARHVTLMVNKGYSSQSAMHEAARRFIRNADDQGGRRRCHLLYLGDHDPSGEDMVRDVADRLEMFGARVAVRKLALTMAQVEEHEPPPNPAKMTDARAAKYVAEHGDSSWEVDALPPDVLVGIIEDAIGGLVDQGLVDAVKEREEEDKAELLKAAKRIVKRGGAS